ncbi:MAG: topoisomerase DNA-binding C4 zinc finger domain-containing protein, partial [Anaerolineales bacterium]|nr:topoisomerase DNA-binding C4 zinc finger domain-containing protein [Anaerolineales bacterium]
NAAPAPTGEACPQCGKPLVQRSGKFGPFVGCSGYPACRYIAGKGRDNAPQHSESKP